MTAYYNEIDPYAAQWLRNLIDAGHIAPGEVDERSIVDVRPDELAGYTQCHFFAGIGGWSVALRLAGWPDDRPVWTGSCPCQPFSAAGARKGFDDERHLWPHWARLVKARRPSIIFGEQVASAVDWLRLVRGDLEALDYAVGGAPIEAACAGADHLRDRFWFVADNDEQRQQTRLQRRGERIFDDGACGTGHSEASAGPGGMFAMEHAARFGRREGRPEHAIRGGRDSTAGASRVLHLADADGCRDENGMRLRVEQRSGLPDASWRDGSESDARRFEWVVGADGKARRVKPGIRLLAHGIPARVAKLRSFGNAIYPQVAAEFIRASVQF